MSLQTESIHGHAVLELIHGSSPALTPTELADEVERRFGAAARFHTCSAEQMTLKQLLQFLFARQKIELRDDGRLYVQLANVCQHQ
jgi:probable metal-binding protein